MKVEFGQLMSSSIIHESICKLIDNKCHCGAIKYQMTLHDTKYHIKDTKLLFVTVNTLPHQNESNSSRIS